MPECVERKELLFGASDGIGGLLREKAEDSVVNYVGVRPFFVCYELEEVLLQVLDNVDKCHVLGVVVQIFRRFANDALDGTDKRNFLRLLSGEVSTEDVVHVQKRHEKRVAFEKTKCDDVVEGVNSKAQVVIGALGGVFLDEGMLDAVGVGEGDALDFDQGDGEGTLHFDMDHGHFSID